MINFKSVSVIASVIALTLCVILLVVPHVMFMLFGAQENSSAFFMGRRAAMLFLGLAILTWHGRNAPHSESRQAICLSITASMFALAVLGVIEYLRGFAGIGILLAVVTETILGLLYFRIWFKYKKLRLSNIS